MHHQDLLDLLTWLHLWLYVQEMDVDAFNIGFKMIELVKDFLLLGPTVEEEKCKF